MGYQINDGLNWNICTKGIKLAPFTGWEKTLNASILAKQLVPLQKTGKNK